MKIDGACHCGFITFEAEADPEKVTVCNCTDCQTLSGAPLRAAVIVDADKFRLLSGEPTTYVKVAESGNKRAQTFCPRCGSPLYATSPDDASAPKMVRLGIVHQREELTPKRQIWARSQPHWVAALADLPSVEKQ
jgi:hypothetical protein